jgi:hypothetical protein
MMEIKAEPDEMEIVRKKAPTCIFLGISQESSNMYIPWKKSTLVTVLL